MTGEGLDDAIDACKEVELELRGEWIARMGDAAAVLSIGHMESEIRLAQQLLRGVRHGIKLLNERAEIG
jgi:hypothetical protein